MAVAIPSTDYRTFTNTETKAWFESWTVDNAPSDFDLWMEWGVQQGATHIVRVSEGGAGTANMSPFRFAIVNKTVARIMVDEDDNGAVWEKWPIRWNW